MKVLFDAYWWHDGPPSGKMVVREMLREWSEHFPDDALVALVRAGRPTANLPAGVQTVPTRVRPHALAALQLSRLARQVGADAIITQNFGVRGKNSCVFVHDVLFQSNPEYFTALERAYLHLITLTLPKPDHVFTSSATEAARIARYNRRVRNVVPVGLGLGTKLLTAQAVTPDVAGGLKDFALTVGRLNIRKNLARAFKAAKVSSKISVSCPLIVVGAPDGKSLELDPEVQALIRDGVIKFTGGVTDGELRWLYEHSSVLIFVSLDEGFGLPPLEALHFGCPVVLSDIPVFREIYSGRATYADPLNPTAIADAVDSVIGFRDSHSHEISDRELRWTNVVEDMRANILNGSKI